MTSKRSWGLALGDILSHLNADTLTSLSSRFSKQEIKDTLLANWWGIESRGSLIYMLAWLTYEGHSESYLYNLNSKIYCNNPFIVKYGDEIGNRALLAWDLGRAAGLIRWGFLVNYLTEDETWGYLEEMAHTLQENYNSWEEYGQHYLLGNTFWRQTTNADKRIAHTIEYLVNNSTSHWQQLDWGMSVNDGMRHEESENPYHIEFSNDENQTQTILIEKQNFFEDFIKRDPNNPYAVNFYAQFVEEYLDNAEIVLQLHYKSIKADPTYQPGYTGIYELLKESQERQNDLVEMFDNWLKHSPDDPTYYYYVGRWLLMRGEYEIAIQYIQKAIELNPNEEDYKYDLAICHWNLENFQEAKIAFEAVLEIDPDNQQAIDNLVELQTKL